jgi:hypothetical protein
VRKALEKTVCKSVIVAALLSLCGCYSFERADFHNYGPPVGERLRRVGGDDTHPKLIIPPGNVIEVK